MAGWMLLCLREGKTERVPPYFVAGVACQGGDARLNGAGCAVHVGLQGAWVVVGRHDCSVEREDVVKVQYLSVS